MRHPLGAWARFRIAASLLLLAGGGCQESTEPADEPASLTITIAGLPPEAEPVITVRGPKGFEVAVTEPQVLEDLQSGAYTITFGEVDDGEYRFGGGPLSVQLRPGEDRSIEVRYQALSGQLEIAIAGLPLNLAAAVLISGPNGFARTITAPATMRALRPGQYRVEPAEVTGSAYAYGAPALTVVVLAGNRADAQVEYGATTGQVEILVDGLPGGRSPPVVILGPGGLSRGLSASETLSFLPPGSYRLLADPSGTGLDQYLPSLRDTSVSLSPGTRITIAVEFALQRIPVHLRYSAGAYRVTPMVVGSVVFPATQVQDQTGAAYTQAAPQYAARTSGVVAVGADGELTALAPGASLVVASVAGPTHPGDSLLALVVPAGGIALYPGLSEFDVPESSSLGVPLIAHGFSSGGRIASGRLRVSFSSLLFDFIGVDAVPGGPDLIMNTSSAITGVLTMSFASATGYPGEVQVGQLHLRARAPGTSLFLLEGLELTSSGFLDLLPVSGSASVPLRVTP